jgi:type III pantothenate kinase
LNTQWPLPFVVDVAKPETVGADRLAAVMAGISMFPKKALLIMDMGTCITYEYVSKEARYWGGAISPGVRLRFQSMHDYTAALPQLQASGEIPPKEGKDTESAMQSGVLYGVKAEVMDRIERFQSENPDSMVILTGGDSWLLGNPPKTRIFVEPKLLHYGLYYAYKSR